MIVFQTTFRSANQAPLRQSPASAAGTLLSSSVLGQIDALLQQKVSNQTFSGSVLITQNRQTVFSKGYSMANWSTQTPNTPDTSFYTGSLTKQFTAMSILMLQYQGKLDISGLVCTYITPCPPPWADVTVKELLTHTSGIPYVPNGGYPTDVSPSVWIASFDTVLLDFPAGSAFEYCNVCYQVLGYITQLVSGLPFSQFVQENILDPLHMTESGFDEAPYYTSPSSAIGYSS